MSFGVVLKDCLNESNASVRNFSQVTGINRGWVYNIFNGKKPLPEDRFHGIINSFPFTKQQKKALSDSYYEDMFGIDSFKKIQFIIESLNKLNTQKNHEYSFANYTNSYNSDSQYIQSHTSLANAIVFLLSYENNNSSAGKKYIYTNFSYEQKKINDITFNYLNQYDNTDFFHIINFDTVGMDIHNLRNIFYSSQYAALGYNTFYYYSNHTIPLQADNIFSYFFITPRGVLLYDNSLTEGLLLLNKNVHSSFISKVDNIFKSACSLVTFNHDKMTFNNKLKQTLYQDNILLNIGFNPFIIYDEDNDSINSYLPTQNNIVYFLHPKGLFDFIKTGENPYIPPSLKNLFSRDDAYKIANELIEHYNKKKNILLLKNDVFSFPSNINISCSANYIYVFGSLKKSSPQFLGDFYICMNNKLLADDFFMFRDYTIKNNLCYNEKHTDFIFSKLQSTINQTGKN